MTRRTLGMLAAVLFLSVIYNLILIPAAPAVAADQPAAAQKPPAVAESDVATVKNVLAIVPSDALAFGLVKNLTEADAKIQKVTTTVGAQARVSASCSRMTVRASRKGSTRKARWR